MRRKPFIFDDGHPHAMTANSAANGSQPPLPLMLVARPGSNAQESEKRGLDSEGRVNFKKQVVVWPLVARVLL
jgi:hypothetical protein